MTNETKLIKETWAFRNPDLTAIGHSDRTAIRQLLLGHRIERIAEDHIELDDGTVVKIVPNEGGCSCGAGDYHLDQITGCDNIITRVEFEDQRLDDDPDDTWAEPEYTYRVFVVAEDKRINLYSVTGDDGNGYYGTGYELLVRRP